ncbi:RidA family protein [Methylobacterium sp. JK268]
MRRRIDGGSSFERDYGYSRAVIEGGFVFVAGTTGYDYAAMTMPEGAGAQAEACWRTIAAVLDEAGSSLEQVVRATYYVTDRADAEAVLAVAGRVMSAARPAATLLVVAGLLRPEMRVEIEVTAALG